MSEKNTQSIAFGYCRFCNKTHSLSSGRAREYCLELMHILEEKGRMDIDVSEQNADPLLTLDYIKGAAGGQMFGVLECTRSDGRSVILKAFSGQYNGVWNVEGWAPPLFDVERFDLLVGREDIKIKNLGKMIHDLPEGLERKELVIKRKGLSQNLMKEIHSIYRIHNFQSQVRLLADFFKRGIPAGAGDCCAPKLLNQAAKQGLKPVSLAEIFWGRANPSGTRSQGNYYSPCEEKCGPLMGFMLCGIEKMQRA